MSSAKTITPAEAIERMSTWIEDPCEATVARLTEAALAFVQCADIKSRNDLEAAAMQYSSEQVERVQTSTGSLGCAADADKVRDEIRSATMIVEVEGHTAAGAMLRARGCHIAYREQGGRWVGVGSHPPERVE